MPMTAIVALAVLTYAFRFTGRLLRGRVTVPAAAERLFADAATVLLIALAATAALTAGHGFAGWLSPRRERVDAARRERLSGKSLSAALGFDPQYLLVTVSQPRDGHCYKVCAAVLPRG